MKRKTYRFGYTSEKVMESPRDYFETPFWIVGNSPFEDEINGQGYVVHLAEPRFLARYYFGKKKPKGIDIKIGEVYRASKFTHDDEDITLCEIVWNSSSDGFDVSSIFEAACAVVAFSHGKISATGG